MRSIPTAERRFFENDAIGYLDPYHCPWCGWWHIGHSKTHTQPWLRETPGQPETSGL